MKKKKRNRDLEGRKKDNRTELSEIEKTAICLKKREEP